MPSFHGINENTRFAICEHDKETYETFHMATLHMQHIHGICNITML
jgi:hypothetical protein